MYDEECASKAEKKLAKEREKAERAEALAAKREAKLQELEKKKELFK